MHWCPFTCRHQVRVSPLPAATRVCFACMSGLESIAGARSAPPAPPSRNSASHAAVDSPALRQRHACARNLTATAVAAPTSRHARGTMPASMPTACNTSKTERMPVSAPSRSSRSSACADAISVIASRSVLACGSKCFASKGPPSATRRVVAHAHRAPAIGAVAAYSFHCSAATAMLAAQVLRAGASLKACATVSSVKGRKLKTSQGNLVSKSMI